MKKILASILTIAMLATTMSACVIPASAEEAAAVATDSNVIYSEDFTGYTQNVNWIEKLSGDYVTNIGSETDTDWSIFGNNLNTSVGSVKVIEDPTGSGKGNILSIDLNGDATSAAPWINVRRNSNAKTGLDRDAMSQGKKLVLSADVYIPGTRANQAQAAILRYSTTETLTSALAPMSFGSNTTTAAGLMMIRNAVGRGYPGYSQSDRSEEATDKWVTVKKIIDLSEDVTAERPADTARHLYENTAGQVLMAIKLGSDGNSGSPINEMFKWESGNIIVDTWQRSFNTTDVPGVTAAKSQDFFGSVFGEARGSAAATTTSGYYIDNVEAYWIDAFKQEGTVVYGSTDGDGNWNGGTMEIPFNNAIKSSVTVETASYTNGGAYDSASKQTVYTVDKLVKLVDDSGNVVAGGIANATVKADDNKVLVVEPAKTLTSGKQYTIVADARFSDVNGQGIGLTGSIEDTIDIYTFTVGFNPYIYSEDFTGYTQNVNWIEKLSGDYVTNIGSETDTDWSIFGNNLNTSVGSVKVIEDPTGSGKGNILSIDLNGDATSAAPWINVRRNSNAKTGLDRDAMSQGKKLVLSADVYIPGTRANQAQAAILRYSTTETLTSALAPMSFGSNTTTAAGLMMIRNAVGRGYPGYSQSDRSEEATDKWVTVKKIIDLSEDVTAERPADTARHLYENTAGQVLMAIKLGSDGNSGSPINEMFKWESGNIIVDTWQRSFNTTDVPGVTAAKSQDFFGSVFGEARGSAAATTTSGYYIDNVEAYWIDAFKQEGTVVYGSTDGDGNWNGGTMEIPFNNAIKSSVTVETASYTNGGAYDSASKQTVYTVDKLVKLVDDSGNVVAGGIANATVKADDNKVLVVEPAKTLTSGKQYTIVADARFSDVNGQGIGLTGSIEDTIDIYTFTVGKFPGVYAVATPVAFLGNTVSTTVTFTNSNVTSMNVWAVVAAYGEYNEMLGCTHITETLEANKSTDAIPFEVSVKNSDDVKYVKLFVWNTYSDMKPYQPAVTL